MSFDVYECILDEKGKRIPTLVARCENIDDCFNVLHKRGHLSDPNSSTIFTRN